MRSGQRVGKYVLGEQIARGGMAEVWAARVEGPGGFVKSLALKFILESFAGDSELERLFLNEARVAANLQHANLVAVFDFDKIADAESGGPGRYYIAMERVDGHDLRRVLQVARHNGHRLSPSIALYVAGEVLKGLRYVHERTDESGAKPLELVHRDVSPHNVLIGMGGEVKLSDFGIAKAMTQSLGTQTGTIRGKLAYASPEQLRGETADQRADQFGLGVTLWEMLADRRLFSGADEMEIVGKVLRCEIPPLPADAGIDAAVESIVQRMLASQAGARFGSTADALSAVLSAPGYTSDAAGLAGWMRDLFGPRTVALPPTVPLNVAAPSPAPVSGLAETSQLERSQSVSPASGPAGVSGDGLGPGSGDGAGSPGSREGAARSPPSDPDAVPSRIEPEGTVTGSAYVSGESPAISAWVAEPQASPRPRRFMWAAAVFAVIAVAGIALVARRAGGPAAPATATIPDGPRPHGAEPVRQAATLPMDPSPRKPAAPASAGGASTETPASKVTAAPDARPVGQTFAGGVSIGPPRSSGKGQGHAPHQDRAASTNERGQVGRAAGATRPARGDKGAAANAAPVLE